MMKHTKYELSADDIISRFTFNDSGEIVYARDMIGGHGAIRKRQGQKVNIIRNGRKGAWERIDFSENGTVKHTTPGVVGFTLSFGKLPKETHTEVCIKSNPDNPNDYRASNLIYETRPDICERGKMRVKQNGKRWQIKILFRGGFIERYMDTESNAIRFAIRYHRWRVKSAFKEFWSHVGINADMSKVDAIFASGQP